MTAHTEGTQPVRLFPVDAAEPPRATEPPVSRPMPRLGRGIVWSNIVAEIERDDLLRRRDAA